MAERTKLLALLVALALFSVPASAQVDPGGIVNSASFRLAQLPGSGIARGSIFTIFSLRARNIGPPLPVLADALPLSTELGGVSVQVTVAGLTVDCPLLFVSGAQVNAILPSDAIAGPGQLRLSFAGQRFDAPITVARHALGLFTQNQAGTGAALAQNFMDAANAPMNKLTQSVNPGGLVTLWGTGLGPVAGNANTPCPAPCQVAAAVEVIVGGIRAESVLYAGRSPQFVGSDQINFVVPRGVLGCYVPVAVVVDGVPSNYTTISIAESGSVCSEPDSFTAQQLGQFLADGQMRTGGMTVKRLSNRIELGGLVQDLEIDLASGGFFSYPAETFHTAAPPVDFLPSGACRVYSFQNSGAEFEDPVRAPAVDAGSELTLSGPRGSRTVKRTADGSYDTALHGRGGDPPDPSLPDDPYLEPGNHVLMGPGGTDVGAFEASANLTAPLTWTNRLSFRNVDKSAGLTVTWSGGDAINQTVRIVGFSMLGALSSAVGAGFVCRADVADGRFTIGPEVLALLPDTDPRGLSGALRVGTATRPVPFTASGLDIAWFAIQLMDSRVVDWE